MKKLAGILVMCIAVLGMTTASSEAANLIDDGPEISSYGNGCCCRGHHDNDKGDSEQKIAGDEASQLGKGSCHKDRDRGCDKEKNRNCDKNRKKDGSCRKASSSSVSENLCGSTCNPDGDKDKDGKK